MDQNYYGNIAQSQPNNNPYNNNNNQNSATQARNTLNWMSQARTNNMSSNQYQPNPNN